MALWGSRPSDLQARIDDIQAGLSTLAGLVGDSASGAGKSAQKTASHAVHDASKALSELGGQIDKALTRAGREGKQVYRAVESKVSDNAMVAVVAAAGVGFLIGTMVFGGGAAKRAVSALTPDSEQRPRRRAMARSRSRGRSRSRRAA